MENYTTGLLKMRYRFDPNLEFIENFAEGKTPKWYGYYRVATDNETRYLKDFENFIKDEWSTLSSDAKLRIKITAYKVLTQEDKSFRPRWWLKLLVLKLTVPKAVLESLLDAYWSCVGEILFQIDYETPEFQAELEESFNQALKELNRGSNESN